MYVMLEQYHFLKCEEQFFSSNIINSPYRGLSLYLDSQIQCPQISNFLGYLKCMRVISKVMNSLLAWVG